MGLLSGEIMNKHRAFAYVFILMLAMSSGFAFLVGCGSWHPKSLNLTPIGTQPPKAEGPVVTLPASLHGTARGMQWWYEQDDGAGALFGVNYTDTGCGGCHVDTMAPDGGCSECHGEASVSEPIANQAELCSSCHGRLTKESALQVR